MSDGLHPQNKLCATKCYNEKRENRRNYYLENRDKIKNYQLKKRDQANTRVNEYVKNRIETDVNFRLIRNTRRRIHHGLYGESKSSSTKEILGIDIDSCRKWIEFQFTPEMNWLNKECDLVEPICMFDVSKDEELKEAFSWEKTQPLLKHIHHQKGTTLNFLDYQLQLIKAYEFIKLNCQEGSY